MGSYYLEVGKTAVKDVRGFWTAHKIVTSVPSPVIGFLVSLILTKGLHSWMQFWQAVETSILSFVAGLVLTILVSLAKAPKLLNDQRLGQIKELAQNNEKLRLEALPPKISKSEQVQRGLLEDKLRSFSDQEKAVLEHILHHGETCPDAVEGRFGKDVVAGAIRKGRAHSILEQGRGYTFGIRPEFADALRFHIHGA